MMITIEKIENGYLVRIEQPDWSETKTRQIMGTDLPPEKTWFAEDQKAVFSILKEYYFDG